MIIVIGLAFLVFSLSYLGIFAVRTWALQLGLVDIPNERSTHDRPIPHGGGMIIVVLTLIGVLVYNCCLSDSRWAWSKLLVYLIGAILIALTGLIDDIRLLPNRIRFCFQSIAAIITIIGFGYWHSIHLPFFGQLYLGWIGLPITFLWIIGLTNAYNFMDGIDGIAGGQAVVAGFGWFVLGWLNGFPIVSVIGIILASSSLGFLFHNWSPARIFMGDVGSVFLGFNFAILPIIAGQINPRLKFIGVLLVWSFIFDAGFTFFCRLLRGENVFTAHRSHLYQRLVIIGYNHGFVTFLYIGLALIGLLIAFFLSNEKDIADWFVVLGFIVGASSLWLFVNWQERRHGSQSP